MMMMIIIVMIILLIIVIVIIIIIRWQVDALNASLWHAHDFTTSQHAPTTF